MPLSAYEQRRWRELEAQLAQDRRLAGLAQRLGTPRRRAAWPKVCCVLWSIGGCLGLALAIAGAASRRTGLYACGMVLLTGTLLLAGSVLVTIGIRNSRRARRTAARWQAGPPSPLR